MRNELRVLMCPPHHYGIYYEINPWMHIENTVNVSLAQSQWLNLYKQIASTGATIELIEPIAGLPDMVFTANAGLPWGGQVLISQFRSPQRQQESSYFKSWFQKNGFIIFNDKEHYTQPPYFEGSGDALFLGNKLFTGYGYRSQEMVYQTHFFQNFEIVLCELIDPYFYHLDTCFCPLNSELAIWFPGAFSAASRKRIEQNCDLIIVAEEEAKFFACNAVVVNNHIILPKGCDLLTRDLEKKGFIVHSCDMSEYIKAGGACKCLTLIL